MLFLLIIDNFQHAQMDLLSPKKKAELSLRVKLSGLTTQTYQSHTEIDGIYFVVAVKITIPPKVKVDTN